MNRKHTSHRLTGTRMLGGAALLTAVIASLAAAPARAIRFDIGVGSVLGNSGVHTGVDYRLGNFDDRLGAHVFIDASRYVNRRSRKHHQGDRRRQEEAAPEAPAGNVELRVSPHRAWVYLNGVRVKEDGRSGIDLPEGRHRLEFLLRGYRTEVTELNVQPGIRYRVERRLSRLQRGEAPDPRLQQPSEPVSIEEALKTTTAIWSPASPAPAEHRR